MANKVCAKKILDCSEQIIMSANCIKQAVWLRGGALEDVETKQAGDCLAEAVKLQEKAMEIIASKL
jgi:hypothetical protein